MVAEPSRVAEVQAICAKWELAATPIGVVTDDGMFRIRHDGFHPVDGLIAFGVMDLICAQQRVVDAANDRGHGVCGIQRLIRIHLAGEICIACDLPAGEIHGIEPRPHLLHGLIACQRAERIHERLVMQILPEFLRAEPGQ